VVAEAVDVDSTDLFDQNLRRPRTREIPDSSRTPPVVPFS